MNIQEQEERDFQPASEAQNCFTEAQMKCAELNASCKVEGSGRYRFTVKFPYYCRSTDALAGMYNARIVETNDARMIGRLLAYYKNNDEISVNVFDKEAPAIRQDTPAQVNSEDVPF